MEANARLNRRGKGISYKEGDFVVAYVKPYSSDDWKAKHLVHWRGPCVVVERKSRTYYVVKEVSTGKKFTRSVALLAPWRGPEPERREKDSPAKSDLVGQLVATVDEEGDEVFSLATVIDVANGSHHFHYLGTTEEDLVTARFYPVYILADGLMFLGDSPPASAKPWVGSSPTTGNFIVAYRIKLTKARRLAKSSARRLRKFKHFVIPSDDA